MLFSNALPCMIFLSHSPMVMFSGVGQLSCLHSQLITGVGHDTGCCSSVLSYIISVNIIMNNNTSAMFRPSSGQFLSILITRFLVAHP